MNAGAPSDFAGERKIFPQKPLGQLRRPIRRCQNARRIHEHTIVPAICLNTRLNRRQRFIQLTLLLIKLPKIDESLRSLSRCRRCSVLRFSRRNIFFLVRNLCQQAMVSSCRVRLQLLGEPLRLVQSSTNNCRSGDIVFAKVAHRMHIGGIQLHRPLKGVSYLLRKRESHQRICSRCLEPVGTSQPHLGIAIVGIGSRRQFALPDGIIGHLLGIVDPAQKLMRLRIIGMRADNLMQYSGCLVYASLL